LQGIDSELIIRKFVVLLLYSNYSKIRIMANICTLCGKGIENYHKDYNCLKIDDTHSVDICAECIHKFQEWQQRKYATLFPTKRAKKFAKKRNTE